MAAPVPDIRAASMLMPYVFQDDSLLAHALTAGDSESLDREGHRSMAQIGDALMGFLVLSAGYLRGLSRQQQQEIVSNLKSKDECAKLARARGLDRMITFSKRQCHSGPQPTTLKNTMAAIVGAVWLDSSDLKCVMTAMEALGFINHAGPYNLPQLATPDDSASSASTVTMGGVVGINDFGNWPDAFDPGEVIVQSNSAALDPSSLPSSFDEVLLDHNLDHLPLDQSFDFDGLPVVIGFNPSESFQTTMSDPGGAEMLHTPPMSDQSQPSVTHGLSSMDLQSRAGMGSVNDEPGPLSSLGSNTSAEQRGAKRKSMAAQEVRPKDNELILTFDEYRRQEEEKLASTPERFAQHYEHLERYRDALLVAPLPVKHHAVATLAVSLGDCKSLIALKQALASLRSSASADPVAGLVRIAQPIPSSERIDIITGLDWKLAHTRMAQWLHVYTLYAEVAREIGRGDVDGWIHYAREEGQPKRGNPRHLEQSRIGNLLEQRVKASMTQGRQVPFGSTSRLRLFGERLHRLKSRFGLGVLALIGPIIRETVLTDLTKVAFQQLFEVIDKHEGVSIRRLSDAALPALRLFLEGSEDQPKLRLEVVEESEVALLPRHSKEMEDLFLVAPDPGP